MVGTTMSRIHDENADARITHTKKFGERGALGDLQNRGVIRAHTGKEAAAKELKDAKLQNTLGTAAGRTRVDWKKAPLGTATNTIKAESTNPLAAAVKSRPPITRSNSVRLGTSTARSVATSGVSLQRHASSTVLGQNKPKTTTTTLTTKLVENTNKLQQAKIIYKTAKPQAATNDKTTAKVEPSLRREDSNLSRKSLSKLKAALSRDANAPQTNNVAVVKPLVKSSGAVVQAPKETAAKPISQDPTSQLKIVSVQTHSTKLLNAVEDIDAADGENLVLVSEYVNDIYDYLYSLEVEQSIAENHLVGQEEVFAKMRAVLVDWINEVHMQFRLAAETYQMAVAIIDMYLQKVKDTKRSHLQLVGVTALFLAAKYEELYPPALSDFVYITDDSYTARQILLMELQIFKALGCNLSRPLPIHFLRRFSKAAKVEDAHHTMSKYFLELVSIEYDMASYKPSEVAAASLFLSLNLLDEKARSATGFNNSLWNATLEYYSRYSAETLRPIASKIAAVAMKAPSAKLKAVYTKYALSKFSKISMRSELYGPLMESIVKSSD